MCSLAPPTALALGFHAAAGASTPRSRPRLAASSSAPTQKRSRGGNIGNREGSAAAGEAPAVPAPGQQRRLQDRMKAELDAVRALHRKAVLLCHRGAGKSGGASLPAAGPRREAPSEAAATRRKTTPTTKPAAEAAHRIKPVKQQQQPPSQRTPLPERKTEKSKEVQERRRRMEEEEEVARAREECRRLVLAMEMATLPDETVHRHELEELGIAPFEYAVTRTRSQALSQDRVLLGVAY